jgi:hypothetical protein
MTTCTVWPDADFPDADRETIAELQRAISAPHAWSLDAAAAARLLVSPDLTFGCVDWFPYCIPAQLSAA